MRTGMPPSLDEIEETEAAAITASGARSPAASPLDIRLRCVFFTAWCFASARRHSDRLDFLADFHVVWGCGRVCWYKVFA